MVERGLVTRVPIWVRVSVVTALVLAGTVVSSAVLGSHGFGGGMAGMHGGRGMGMGADAQPEQEPNAAGAGAASSPVASGHVRPNH